MPVIYIYYNLILDTRTHYSAATSLIAKLVIIFTEMIICFINKDISNFVQNRFYGYLASWENIPLQAPDTILSRCPPEKQNGNASA